MEMSENPLSEVFGFPISDNSASAKRYRSKKLCPFNNKVPNCTKDKADNPLGVCSIHHNGGCIITCPVRFRQDWLIIEDAADFAFGNNVKWTSVPEIKLKDKFGKSAGNLDFVLIAYDDNGSLIDFASLEVQAVYISGDLRNSFEAYLNNPSPNFSWSRGYNYPTPDYLSSSRKRLVPQMLYKGGIFNHWMKKQIVALQKPFFDTLPALPTVSKEKADIAWLIYDLVDDRHQKNLKLIDTVYTEFDPALLKITKPEPGDIASFENLLQSKLDEHLDDSPPDAPSLTDMIS